MRRLFLVLILAALLLTLAACKENKPSDHAPVLVRFA